MKSRGIQMQTLSHDYESKRALCHLVHAASHSLKDLDNVNLWPSDTSSSSDDRTAKEAVKDQLFVSNLCRSSGCRNLVSSGSLCVANGGSRPCGLPNCACSTERRGLCVQHGGGRQCSHEGCKKHVASSGLCRAHGGGRRCQVPECMSSAQSRGLCYVHGGGGRCQREGCGSSAKKGGFCIAHGGGHRCEVTGCTSSAVSGARCRAHGGGRRCAVEDCTSSAKTGGRCIAHGGGKRCTVNGCTSSAQRLGLCKAHGGGRRCLVDNCANSAVSRGHCIAHGGGKRCVFEGCTTTARKGGFCFAHGGRSTPSVTSSRSKLSSPPYSRTPVLMSKSRPWSSAEEHLIPLLTLPSRRLLPPINSMLQACRPGVLRQHSPVPPIRRPVKLFERGVRGSRTVFEDWPSPDPSPPAPSSSQRRPRQTPTSASPSSGYSWQRLQETIRRESRAHGIPNEDDETVNEDRTKDGNETANSNWTRYRDLLLLKRTRQI